MAYPGKRDDMVVHEQDPYNAETAPEVLAASAVTPVDAFYSRNHGPVPELDPATWRLEVDGLVGTPTSFTLKDLRRDFEQHELTATMQCAGNRRAGLAAVAPIPGEALWDVGTIGTARWAGARLADVLAAVGVADGATDVVMDASDVSQQPVPPETYGSSIPVHKALRPEVLLAWQMNDAPLTAAHGAPVRVVVPGYVGARSVKWVRRVTLQDHPSEHYFQATAYRVLPPSADAAAAGPGDGISLGPWSLTSAILVPADGDRPAPGRTRVRGYALAPEHRSVERVDVSVDGGATWAAAVLEHHGPWAWTTWHLDVDLAAGHHEVVARAWDDSATVQPSDPASLWNPKGYANSSWPRVAVDVRG
ncbi:MAG: sulfite oxidase [Nocardioidaceae bacterium]|nr:sulfite oxidase [Nocardioidaceae bacterium]